MGLDVIAFALPAEALDRVPADVRERVLATEAG